MILMALESKFQLKIQYILLMKEEDAIYRTLIPIINYLLNGSILKMIITEKLILGQELRMELL